MLDAFKFIRRIREQVTPDAPAYRLATVQTYTAGQGVTVIFDGEGTDSGAKFPVAGSYLPVVGQRVIMQKIGSTYVVMSSVGLTPDYQFSRKTDSQSWTNNTTFAEITSIRLPGAANCKYDFTVNLGVLGVAAADIRTRLRMPSGASADYGIISMAPANTSVDGTGRWVYRRGVTDGSTYDVTGLNDLSTDGPVLYQGVISFGSTAGNFFVEACQDVSSGSSSWVLQGSRISMRRIA